MHAIGGGRQSVALWLRRWLGLTLGFVLLAGCTPLRPAAFPAQPRPTSTVRAWPVPTQQKSIVVVGDGSMRVQTNIAQITFSIEVVDESVLTAHRVASDTMQSVIDTLISLDIAAADIIPNSYNVWAERYYPGYVREDPGTVPLFPDPNEETRYRVIHQIRVLVREPERVTEVVDALAEAGGEYFYLYGVDHLFDDPASLEHDAKMQAIADARRKAEEIARLIDAQLGPVISISELVQGGYNPANILEPALWPGQQQFYKQLQVEYAIVESAAITPSAIIPSSVISATQTGQPAERSGESERAVALGTSEVIIQGGDEAALREFLRQFYVQTFAPITSQQTTVYIGAMPPDMPFTLQISPTVTVAGTVVTTGDYANSQYLFTTTDDVTGHLTALRQQFEQQNFAPPQSGSSGVFVTGTPDHISLCSEDNSLAVTLSGRNLDDGTGVLRIYVNAISAFGGACGQPGESGQASFDALLPTLEAPVAISVYSSGGGGDDRSYETTIRFVAQSTVSELAAHYVAQLEEHGWQQLGASQTDDLAWSGWSFSAGAVDYFATFYVVAEAGSSDRFQTTLRLERAR